MMNKIRCNIRCDCKTCRIYDNEFICGECYYDSLEQCLLNGIHNCRGYIPSSFLKRLWWCIKGKLSWWQLR